MVEVVPDFRVGISLVFTKLAKARHIHARLPTVPSVRDIRLYWLALHELSSFEPVSHVESTMCGWLNSWKYLHKRRLVTA